MELAGAEFGAFEVWGSINQGGMSRVWLARHRELAVPVILKTLLGGSPDEALERLRNEARLMARIPSPRVVRPVDVGAREGVPYLAQEYVDGLDLAELDKKRRQALKRGLPLWFVARVVHDVAEALHSAHQTGVLHRDVKPSNLFGSPQTGIRLGDFGIAVARGGANVDQSGTLRFVSPETLRGQAPTRAADVYSLGATAFDLFYGTPPFTTMQDIVGAEAVRFPEARTAEEAYFQHVLGRMLARDVGKRFDAITVPMRLFAALVRSLEPPFAAHVLRRGVYQLGPVRVVCVQGDIAHEVVDGIVRSANDSMSMQHGVGEALKRRGGQIIEDEALAGGPRALGECVPTTGGALACKRVLHAVSAWKEASCIARTCQRAFLLAEELGLHTIAIPAIGTGSAKVAPEACAYAAASALYEHVLLGGTRLREVRFVLYDAAMLEIFCEELAGVFLGDLDPIGDEESRCGVDEALDATIALNDTFRTEREG